MKRFEDKNNSKMSFHPPVTVDNTIIRFVNINQYVNDSITSKMERLKHHESLEDYEECAKMRDDIDALKKLL